MEEKGHEGRSGANEPFDQADLGTSRSHGLNGASELFISVFQPSHGPWRLLGTATKEHLSLSSSNDH